MGDLVDLGADALKNIGGAVDDSIKQIHQHAFPGHFRGAGARELVFNDGKGPRVVVTHGCQPVTGENKGDRRRLRCRRVRLAHQRRRHVARAVLDIETAGDLNLLHLLAGRHGDAEHLLDQLVFLHGRRDHVDPHRVVRNLGARLDGNALERRAVRDINRKHSATVLRAMRIRDHAAPVSPLMT